MKVLLVDDHPLILSALKAMIEKLRADVQVTPCDSAAALREALAAGEEHDLLLLDLQLGDALGFDLLRELRASRPELPVVVISASDRHADVLRAVDLGAMGFLPKRLSTEALADAIRVVISGGIFVPPGSLELAQAQAGGEAEPELQVPAEPMAAAYPKVLSTEQLRITPRQHDVLQLLLQGKPNKDIARRLGLSVETVKDHVQAVLRALGVNSRTQAVLAVGRMSQQQPVALREPDAAYGPDEASEDPTQLGV